MSLSSLRSRKYFFVQALLAFCLLTLLTGCEHRPGWMNNVSGWFGGKKTVDQSAEIAHPGYGKGPLASPEAAPVPSVQATPLPVDPNAAPGAPPVAPVPPPKTKVAILLPLTGKNAALGQAMLNAAQLAVFDNADSRFELMPRDTGSDGALSETVARDAVAGGAQLIIGPVFAANIPAVHKVAQASNINMLTLSTDTSLAGPGVFVMGFVPMPQVERVVSYASLRGLHHFGAIIPNNAYGNLVGKVFQDSVTRWGGTVVSLETFDLTKHDSDVAVRKLARHRDRINALFLPEGGNDLTTLAGQLITAGFDSHRIRLLGTGLWDVSDIAKQSSFLVSGWYAAPDPAARLTFMKAYATAYKSDPPRLATLAYDATALAAVLSKQGSSFDTASLTNPNGFAGLDGIFRLTPQGFAERGLAVNEISPTGPRVVDPAPASFAGN